jgi:formylglycine-generating enzyme required for sulfatase activity
VTQSSTFDSSLAYLTDVGAYTSALSHYGAFDMGGDVWQWNDTSASSSRFGSRGGSWTTYSYDLAATERGSDTPNDSGYSQGFRLVEIGAIVPEPGSFALLALGAAGLLLWARRRNAA